MKIKKYEASSEKEAMLMVKDELGKDALIVSVKKIKPKGIYRIFKKPYVEVTAALDDKELSNNEEATFDQESKQSLISSFKSKEVLEGKSDESFVRLLKNLAKASDKGVKYEPSNNDNNINEDAGNNRSEITSNREIINKEEPYIKVVYEQLMENEVSEEYVNQLMAHLSENADNQSEDIDAVVSIVYKRLIKLLGDVEPISLNDNGPKTIAFVGPTGVGKTTTIAKLASYFTLNKNKKVALITSDTYRIAAVEQLRTYANILNIPIKVVYTTEELVSANNSFSDFDLIFIDTAGRSHKNNDRINDLSKIINSIEDVDVYLVLSLSTKYKDLLKISQSYEGISKYKLIFTKLDETSSYGNILNLKLKTNAKLSYITYGQNVPDDISEVDVYDVAKKTLGGCE